MGLGSGVVVDQTGAILTSLHVVAGADAIEVTFADGTKSAAAVSSTQPENDIALLQVEQLPPWWCRLCWAIPARCAWAMRHLLLAIPLACIAP